MANHIKPLMQSVFGQIPTAFPLRETLRLYAALLAGIDIIAFLPVCNVSHRVCLPRVLNLVYYIEVIQGVLVFTLNQLFDEQDVVLFRSILQVQEQISETPLLHK